MVKRTGVLLAAVLCALQAQTATIYVDKANISATTNGQSWTTAWTTLAQAADDLSNKNAVVKGGHVIWVNPGTYTSYATITFALAHSGTNGSPNVVLTNGTVVLQGTVLALAQCSYLTVDGFSLNVGGAKMTISGGTNVTIQNCAFGGRTLTAGFYALNVANSSAPVNLMIRRCNVVDCGAYGIYFGYLCTGTVENCTFVNVDGGGFYAHFGLVYVRNSIFVNCALYGVRNADISGLSVSNCCFFANGDGNVTAGGVLYDTAAAINANPRCGSNIVANPNFADLANNWNLNKFYTNSPCLNAGIGGVDIGQYENPPTVPTSSNTYYVATNGNDTADGLSLPTAWRSIAKAATMAIAGNTVRIQAGAYTNTAQVTLTNAGSGPLPTTYLADGSVVISNTLYMDRVSSVVLDGLECTKAIQLSKSYGNTIRNGKVHDSNTDGIYLEYSCGNTIERMSLYNNARHGLQEYARSGPLISRCAIFSNAQHGIGLGPVLYQPTTRSKIYNCIIYANASNGVFLGETFQNSFPSEIVNCNIATNGAQGVNVFWRSGAASTPTPFIVNCIITGNRAGVWEVNAACDASLSNNCFYSNAGTNFYDEGTTVRDTQADINSAVGCGSNIVANPLMYGPDTSGGFRLLASSPCLNAGASWPAAVTDYYGYPHGFRNGWDIGSYEFRPPAGTVFSFW